MCKKALVLFFAFLFSIESMAAVVSDNDGSAFITKAEFDSLKNNFQAQLDNYNSTIDNKIDNAIASYLSGINLGREELKENVYVSFKTKTGQSIKNLKWSNSSTFYLNLADLDSNRGDTQKILQTIEWYQAFSTQGGHQVLIGPPINETKENRIEVGNGTNIIGWGEYAPSCKVQAEVVRPKWDTGSFFSWAPTATDKFAPAMRKQTQISQVVSYSTSNYYIELNVIKYLETLPTDLTSFDMDMIQIAPLSTSKEATLPPAPRATDADFEWVDGNEYGENKYHTDRLRTQYTDAPTNWTKTRETHYGATTIPAVGGTFFNNLEARWFRICDYNILSFDQIDSKYGFQCPMKCGLPISNVIEFKDGDKLVLNIKGSLSNGYLVPYVSQTPSDTWNGAKSNYMIDKYAITAGIDKKIELEIDHSGTYYVFAVWLPNTACVMPEVTINRVITNSSI